MVPRSTTMAAYFAFWAATCLAATARADEQLACRSVHLRFPAPEGAAFINELTIDESSEGTYFCAAGFNQGYFGLQELANGKKVVIFSVWEPGNQDDPNAVAEDRRVKLVSKDDAVRVGRFGNEGTGGQSFLDYDWQPGATYRFLVTAKLEGERTAFSAYFCPPEARLWRHLATFSTIAGGKRLGGYYAFVEDFRRNRISATRQRKARFGNGWVQGLDGHWVALTRARFTADKNPAENIDAGVAEARFFLMTGGTTVNTHVPLGQDLDRPPGGVPEVP